MKYSKRLTDQKKNLDSNKLHTMEEAIPVVKANANCKFDETVDVAIMLGVNPRHADQNVRGTVQLPHGLGKEIKVLVFASGDDLKTAEEAGADFFGNEELVEKIKKEEWFGFDVAIAAPDMMRHVGKIGRLLGPRGLMPNPKLGTVTKDIAQAVEAAKAGKIEFRVDKAGNVHCPIGKASFEVEKLQGNFQALVDALLKAKPASAKGAYFKKASIASTMGCGIKLNAAVLGKR